MASSLIDQVKENWYEVVRRLPKGLTRSAATRVTIETVRKTATDEMGSRYSLSLQLPTLNDVVALRGHRPTIARALRDALGGYWNVSVFCRRENGSVTTTFGSRGVTVTLPPGMSEAQMAAKLDFKRWWMAEAEAEFEATDTLDSPHKFATVGHAFAGLQPGIVEYTREHAAEVGLYFQILSAVGSWSKDVLKNERPADSLLAEIVMLTRLAQWNRTGGQDAPVDPTAGPVDLAALAKLQPDSTEVPPEVENLPDGKMTVDFGPPVGYDPPLIVKSVGRQAVDKLVNLMTTEPYNLEESDRRIFPHGVQLCAPGHADEIWLSYVLGLNGNDDQVILHSVRDGRVLTMRVQHAPTILAVNGMPGDLDRFVRYTALDQDV